MLISEAMEVLKENFEKDFDYAWAWQCNIAMSIYDEGGISVAEANRCAARFMKSAFDVDITKHEFFKDTQIGYFEE